MSASRWLLLLVVAGVVLRIGLWAGYQPTEFPDTGTYVMAAKDLVAGDLSLSEGRRTPGYPALMALAGLEPQRVWMLQMLAGLAVSLVLFYIALLMTGRPGFAFAIGLTYDINLAQLFFEGTLLSETATTLSVVAVVAVMVNTFHRIRDARPATGALLLLGLAGGIAILTRPQFVFLPLLLPVLIVFASTGAGLRAKVALKNAATAAAPALLLVLAWCAWVYLNVGFFTLSTQSGFGLSNQSIAFVEFAPDRYATIRDILLKHRVANLASKGHYRDTIWDALPEIRKTTGLSLPEVSREVQRMSVELFVRHPVQYGVGVAAAWISFWLVPNPWRLEQVTPSWLGAPLAAVWWAEHKILRLANAVFVLLVLAAAVWPRARRSVGWDMDMTGISAVILVSSIVQALAEYGGNARYGVTIQALVVLLVLVAWLRNLDMRLAPSGVPRTSN